GRGANEFAATTARSPPSRTTSGGDAAMASHANRPGSAEAHGPRGSSPSFASAAVKSLSSLMIEAARWVASAKADFGRLSPRIHPPGPDPGETEARPA